MATLDGIKDIGIDKLGSVTDLVGLGVYAAIGLLILIIIGVLTFYTINLLKYNKKIIILEDVSGSDDLEIIGRDRATLVKIGKSGMEVLFLKGRKKYIGAYGKRMGKNTYNMAVGPDGYWYNVTLGSLDEGLKKIKIKPTNVNMRYQNEGLMQTLKSRYDEVSFWQKYGGIIAYTMLIFLTGIMVYLLFDKFIEISANINSAVKTAAEVQTETARLLGALDNVQSGGGIQSV